MTAGEAGPPDDPSIPDEEILYRRIARADSIDMITTDADTGARMPSSGVFKSSDVDGISVYLDSVLLEADLVPADLLRAPANAVCSIRAKSARANALGVIRDPWPPDTDEPSHPRHGAHALVTGMNRLGSKVARQVARELARRAVLVIDPGGEPQL